MNDEDIVFIPDESLDIQFTTDIKLTPEEIKQFIETLEE
tara:strand:- start:1166 stop:1282 length:117 start_codon:yes stop_codon:yes gene_type:complete